MGDPIAHSLSPVIHLAAYRELGLNWDFRCQRVRSGTLNAFLTEADAQLRGLAVTMPLKPEALQAATFADGLAKVTGAVNTLVPAAGGDWTGFNTDVRGVVEAFRQGGATNLPSGGSGVIFGSGSTAASALAAFTELGLTELTVISRTTAQTGAAFPAAQRMGLSVRAVTWHQVEDVNRALRAAQLVMGTVPAPVQDALPLSQLQIISHAIFLDAAYAPWPTPIVSWAQRCGAQVIPGWEMLLHQGVAQVKLFTGQEVNAEILRPALLRNLPNRH
ncbi:shikimate dehydrogenase [uncultured Mobiluncus sp.]|uniref:shikimate dehydrogenase family protein n=1 Tax=uncultured Mobiluncus sp. TaxID=293425 RepID=UPI0025F8E5C7|nr:shikimate dehydrogenase [uncultured Mobiluncus sp.]